MSKNYVCECGKEFDNLQKFNGHKSHCQIHYLHKYGNDQKYAEQKKLEKYYLSQGPKEISNKSKKLREDSRLKWEMEKHTCERCGKVMTEKFGSGRFCSRNCANKRVQSNRTKTKISIKIKLHSVLKHQHTKDNYDSNPKYCKYCAQKIPYERRYYSTCSKECSINYCKILNKKRSIKGVLANNKRSKNEVYFYELCEQTFSNVRHNEPIFNGWDADIIIDDIHYAILWNGPWHYKQITKNHSVKQVQNRDNIKIKEIQNYGYIPYIIKDNGSYNKDFVESQFKLFLKEINK